jgi:hypothetical protein
MFVAQNTPADLLANGRNASLKFSFLPELPGFRG